MQIIEKWLLCVKHYYHTTFGIPKKITHSGIARIQKLNRFVKKEFLYLFQLDQAKKGLKEENEKYFTYKNLADLERLSICLKKPLF
jgi:hypothetical protein